MVALRVSEVGAEVWNSVSESFLGVPVDESDMAFKCGWERFVEGVP